MISKFIDIREICDRLQLAKPDTVLAAIKAKELRAIDVSSPGSKRPTWRIRPEDFDAFLELRSGNRIAAEQPRRRVKTDPKIHKFF